MFVDAGEVKVVVDPGDSARLGAASTPRPDPKLFKPVHLVKHLSKVGVRPKDVTHVVVTHLHFDHYAGVSVEKGGSWEPTFPSARHLIPLEDWNMPDIADARKKGDKDVATTLGVIERAGLVRLVKGRVEICRGVTVEPFPGESPGHQILSVASGGKHCYCIGDLYHTVEEAVDPGFVATWTDRETLVASKKRFASRASRERALVLAGHIGPGMVSVVSGKTLWEGA